MTNFYSIIIKFQLLLYTTGNVHASDLPAGDNESTSESMISPSWNTFEGIAQGITVPIILLLLLLAIIIITRFRGKANALEVRAKQFEHELKIARENEKFMNDIISHFNEYLFFHDMDGNFLEFNPAYQRDYDYNNNDIKRMNIRDLVTEPYKKEVNDYLERIRNADFDSGYINVVDRKGNPAVLEYMCSVIYHENGNAVGVRGISRNISDRVEARKSLRESEKKYRNILESIEDGYYEVDLKGNYRFFNTSLCRMLNYPSGELLGKNYRETVHEDYQKNVFKTFNYVYRTGKPVKTFDLELVRKDGKTYLIEQSVSLCKDDNDNPIGFQGIVRDVSEKASASKKRKELEDQLYHAQKMESIGTLAGGIAHDFNNILFPIIGYTELAMKVAPLGGKAYEHLEKVFNSANRAKDLVAQILKFSRHSDEKSITPTLIQPIIKETLKMLGTTVPSNIEIRTDISEKTGKVLISHSRIHQVIMNLCTNAYQAMEEKRNGFMLVALKEIEVGKKGFPGYNKVTPGRYILLSVSDNGTGIEPGLIKKIVEPYFTTKSPEKGTGLGLSVSYGIIKNAGGTMLIESIPGEGTRFDIFFPVACESGDMVIQKTPSIPDPTGHERILLVDDEQRIVELQQQVLENLGYHVTGTSSSVKALEIFQPNLFDLVLTDQTMPGMTGMELSEKIRERHSDMPIILCTGYYNDKTTRKKARELKINLILQKPITQSEIAIALRKVLDNKLKGV